MTVVTLLGAAAGTGDPPPVVFVLIVAFMVTVFVATLIIGYRFWRGR